MDSARGGSTRYEHFANSNPLLNESALRPDVLQPPRQKVQELQRLLSTGNKRSMAVPLNRTRQIFQLISFPFKPLVLVRGLFTLGLLQPFVLLAHFPAFEQAFAVLIVG